MCSRNGSSVFSERFCLRRFAAKSLSGHPILEEETEKKHKSDDRERNFAKEKTGTFFEAEQRSP